MSAIRMDGWTGAEVGSSGERRPDALGFAAGWRAAMAFGRLQAMTDAELAAEGLTRADAPRVALAALRGED